MLWSPIALFGGFVGTTFAMALLAAIARTHP